MKPKPAMLYLGGSIAASIAAYYLLKPDPTEEDPSLPESQFQSAKRIVGIGIGTLKSVVRGKRLSVAHLNSAGVVLDTVSALVSQASVSVGRSVSQDAYSLARGLSSEGGSEQGKNYKAHVLLNQARQAGLSITALALKHTNPIRNGHFGHQIGGRFATTQDPYADDLTIAEQSMSEADTTSGAIEFGDEGAFGGVQKGTGKWEDYLASQVLSGKKGGYLEDSSTLFWWTGSLPTNATPIEEV